MATEISQFHKMIKVVRKIKVAVQMSPGSLIALDDEIAGLEEECQQLRERLEVNSQELRNIIKSNVNTSKLYAKEIKRLRVRLVELGENLEVEDGNSWR